MLEEGSYKMYIYKVVSFNLNYLSIAGAALVLLIMIGLTLYDRRLVDRVTLRLQTAIAVYDIWFHSGTFWMSENSTGPGPLCTFIAWSIYFSRLVYYFLNISIALNLKLVFLRNVFITRNIEIAYWAVSIGSAFLITLIPLCLNMFGFDNNDETCFLKANNHHYFKIAEALVAEVWLIFTIVYLFIITLLVVRKLRSGIRGLRIMSNFQDNDKANEKEAIIVKMIYRILLYPIVMFVTQLGIAASQLYFDANGSYSDNINYWASICSSLTGTLNFLAFCCDPTLHSAIWAIYVSKFGGGSSKDQDINLRPTVVGLNLKVNQPNEEVDCEEAQLDDEERNFFLTTRVL